MGKDASANIKRRDSFKYVLVAEGVIIGLISGAVVSLFRLSLVYADRLRDWAGGLARSSFSYALIYAAVLIAIVFIISLLLGCEPDIAGSGIPQVEAELRGRKDMRWHRVLAAKFAGCALAIGGGLALGREGPSIQLGAMVGKGFSRMRKRLLTEERLLITCGAGAGLSAAFGAPLAGALFALEELHRNFSAEVLLSAMAASAASEFVAGNVFGLSPVFGFETEHGLPLSCYWALILLGLLLGLLGMLYNSTIASMQDIFDRAGLAVAGAAERLTGAKIFNNTDHTYTKKGEAAARTGRLFIMFSCAIVLVFLYPDALGSGSWLVGETALGKFSLAALASLFIIKFIYSTACFGSGSPGGIFLPLLVLGASAGGLFCRVLGLFGFDQKYMTAMVVVAMAGAFSAIVRAPVTGIILITEMTGDFTCLLPLVMTSLIAYVTAELLKVEPIYTQLLNRSSAKARGDSGRTGSSGGRRSGNAGGLLLRDRKVVLDADIHTGSFMDGKSVMEFGLPMGTLIISVMRGGAEIIPDGHTILRDGDILEILTREQDIQDVEDIVEEKCRKALPELK